jgi:hypothetical protein
MHNNGFDSTSKKGGVSSFKKEKSSILQLSAIAIHAPRILVPLPPFLLPASQFRHLVAISPNPLFTMMQITSTRKKERKKERSLALKYIGVSSLFFRNYLSVAELGNSQ